jgi:integrase
LPVNLHDPADDLVASHRRPHDLHHRFISVKIREGIPVTEIAAHVGHSRKSLTLDTYAHVLIDD